MTIQTSPLLEAVTWAAASGRVQDIEHILSSQDVPKAVRDFGAEVAAAGGHLAIVALLTPTVH